MTSIELVAPAKVNLFLKVLGKRPDGYHDILTLFERINLFDRIRIEKLNGSGIEILSNRYIVRRKRDNLAYRAARLILDYAHVKKGVRVEIDKRIPVAGGLGGGSSDAASVLEGVNRLFAQGLKKDTLVSLAKKIGADVTFFLTRKSFAIGTGRGDELHPVALKKRKLWHLLVYPKFSLSTKEVYKGFDSLLTKGAPGVKMQGQKALASGTFELLYDMLYNDLQQVVIKKKKSVGVIIKRLASICRRKAIISGSGPSVFCLFKNRKEAMAAREGFLGSLSFRERKEWQIFVVETL